MKSWLKYVVVGYLTCWGGIWASAQTATDEEMITYFVEATASASTSSSVPFWLRTNTYGITPYFLSPLSARVGLQADYEKPTVQNKFLKDKKFDYGYGIEMVANTGAQTGIILPEAYVKFRLGRWELYGGRRREIVGLVDSTLSSGSYAWSGNALPMPKIQLGIHEFWAPKFLGGLLAFKGYYAHGWFNNDRSDVSHSWLHQKVFYGRLGKPNWTVKLIGGFNHQVQWGGQYRWDDKLNLATDLNAYWFVVAGKSTNNLEDGQVILGQNEGTNRIGNHLGSIDLGAEIDFETFSLLLYRQHLYDDGSLFYLLNIADGLNGISYRNKLKKARNQPFYLHKANAEFFYAINQGGPIFGTTNEEFGRDNYFNHAVYTDGWTYHRNIIGTPFYSMQDQTRPNLPRYNGTELQRSLINNNRVAVFHLAAAGQFHDMSFEAKASYSRNLGTYELHFGEQVQQFSLGLRLVKPMPRWWEGAHVFGNLGLDVGGLYPNNLGLQLGIRTVWRE
jgi:Capsule assembly protein Wzi